MKICEPADGLSRGTTIDTLRRTPRALGVQFFARRVAPGRICRGRSEAGYASDGSPRSRRRLRVSALLCRDEKTQFTRSHRRRGALYRWHLLPTARQEPSRLSESLSSHHTDEAAHRETSETRRRSRRDA